MKAKSAPQWLGRPIAEEEHAHDLEQAAALNEFGRKMPRDQAEEQAHTSYSKEQHAKAAAHHLAGMKGSHAAGSMAEARKHSVLYDLHLRKLGHDSSGPVPDIVSRYLTPDQEQRVCKFSPHKADLLALEGTPEDKVEKSEASINSHLETILRACRFLVVADSLK